METPLLTRSGEILAGAPGYVAWALLAGGVASLTVGHHLVRLASGALTGGAVFGAVFVATSHLPVDRSTWLVASIAGGMGTAFAVFAPRAGAFLAGLAVGAVAGLWVGRNSVYVDPTLAPVAGAMTGIVAATFLRAWLHLILPSLFGGVLLSAGGWMLALSLDGPRLLQIPSVWLAITGVVAVCGTALEQARIIDRDARRMRRADAKARAERERVEREREERFKRYMTE